MTTPENRRDQQTASGADKASMIRSEQHLNVDKRRYPTKRVVLRKYVVEETRTIEVPVRREEVRVEREAVSATDGYGGDVDRAELNDEALNQLDNGAASLVLYEERVRVEKDIIPIERVTLHKEIVRDTATITEDLAKERIVTDSADHRHP